MTTVVGLNTARGGSKGVPHRNVKLHAGSPLTARTIEAALQSNVLSRAIVSSDGEEIAQVSTDWAPRRLAYGHPRLPKTVGRDSVHPMAAA
jgi:CMP-N-acetylneuraminic acid synthetase